MSGFVEDGYLKTGLCDANGSHFTFGKRDWDGYEFRVQACTASGGGELLLGGRCGRKASYRLVLGAGGDPRPELVRGADLGGHPDETTTVSG